MRACRWTGIARHSGDGVSRRRGRGWDCGMFENSAKALIASRSAAGTRRLYTHDLQVWLAHCQTVGEDPADPKTAAVTFRDLLLQTQASLTVRRKLAALSKMYKKAVADGTATHNPFDTDALPRPSQDDYEPTQPLTDEEVVRIIAAVKDGSDLGLRDAAVVQMLYDTGARISSILSIERQSLVRRDGALFARAFLKGGRRGEIAIPEASDLALQEWISHAPRSRYVFPAARGGGHLQPIAINKRLAACGLKIGIADVHPHRFRVAFATAALDVMPLHEVQAAMHHADPKTTLRYDRKRRGAGVADAVAKSRRRRP